MIQGACLCGEVRFEVDGSAVDMISCHCSRCRKAYGSAFGTILVVKRDDFRYLQGTKFISNYQSSARVNRPFCSSCGSRLPIMEEWDPLVGIPAGLLDGDPEIKNTSHIFVGSQASWWAFNDASPRYAQWAPASDLNERHELMKSVDLRPVKRKE